MGVSFLCQGCGTRTAVPEDYARKKMQCPACGVMCEVPAAGKKAPEAPRSRRASEPPSPRDPVENKREEVPVPAPGPAPVAAAPPADRPKAGPAIVPCPQCRQPVQVPAELEGHQVRCRRCGVVVAEPEAWDVTGGRVPGPPAPVADDTGPGLADEADDVPYGVTGGVGHPCPGCGRMLAPEARVCGQCGFNLETGRKPPKKVHEPLERHWEAGLPLAQRVLLFVILEGAQLGAVALGVTLGASPAAFLGSALFISGLLVFLLGTYDRIDLERNRRGRVRLARTWRVCFVRCATVEVGWRDCDNVATGTTMEVDLWDWVVAVCLFGFLVIPGVVWWFLMHKVSYFVALTKDHGYPVVMLYKGWSEGHMEELARTVHEVTGLPLEGG